MQGPSNGVPQAQQEIQVVVSTQPLADGEIAVLQRMEKDPEEWVAVQADVPTYVPMKVQPDGSIVWQAVFVTPRDFFKFQQSRLVDAQGGPAGVHRMMDNTFLKGVFPFVRLLVKREGLGEHVPMPMADAEERQAVLDRFGAADSPDPIVIEEEP
jgi:hypothetical protein